MPWGRMHTHILMHEQKGFQETRRVGLSAPHIILKHFTNLNIANNCFKTKIVYLQKFICVEIILYTLY